jgi:azurin
VGALVNVGMAAGLARNYQAANDPRILASTPVLGGGESSTISFSTAKLQPGADYSFFCTYPGHAVMMKGAFVFGDRSGRRVASTAPTKPATATP